MGKKRKNAMKNGKGLFQMMSKKASDVAKKKEEQIVHAQLAKEKTAEENVILRQIAVDRAVVAKEKEKALIGIRNEEIRVAAVARLEKVELMKGYLED